MKKSFFLSLVLLTSFCVAISSCAKNEQQIKTAKSRAAQDRLNSSQSGSGETLKNLD